MQKRSQYDIFMAVKKANLIFLLIAVCLFVFAAVVANINREEWQEEKEAENRNE